MSQPKITFTPLRPALLKGLPTELKVLLQVKAPERPKGLSRKPMNLAVVIDRSGSMASEQKLEEAKRCARFVQERLDPRDMLSLVSFESKVKVEATPGPARPHPTYLKAVDQMEVDGMTRLFEGWESAVNLLKMHQEDYPINRVILLSDGMANKGLRDPDAIKAHCQMAASKEITTSTYGVGRDFDEHLMRVMAEAGGGQLRYGERASDLFEGFVEELDLLQSLYASQLQLSLSPAKGVSVVCENDLIEEGGKLLLPDLAYGAEVWAGLTLKVSPEAATSGRPLLNVRVARKEQGVQVKAELEAPPSLPPEVFTSVATSDAVEAYFAELRVSKLKDKAAKAAKARNWAQVEELIAQMKALPLNDQQRGELEVFERLSQQKKEDLFAKEAHTSSSRAMRSMKLNQVQYMQQIGAPQPVLPSFVRRKKQQGRTSDSQS
jgi:Ca-activated chloride channel family protein